MAKKRLIKIASVFFGGLFFGSLVFTLIFKEPKGPKSIINGVPVYFSDYFQGLCNRHGVVAFGTVYPFSEVGSPLNSLGENVVPYLKRMAYPGTVREIYEDLATKILKRPVVGYWDRDIRRRTATMMLAALGPKAKSAVPVLIRNSRTPVPSLRELSISALAQVDPSHPKVLPLLQQASTNPPPELQRLAISGLAQTPGIDVHRFSTNADPEIRAAVALGLGLRLKGSTNDMPLYLSLAQDSHPLVQLRVANGFGFLDRRHRSALPVLERFLTHSNLNVRMLAAKGIWEMDRRTNVMIDTVFKLSTNENMMAELAPVNAVTMLKTMGEAAAPLVPDIKAILKKDPVSGPYPGSFDIWRMEAAGTLYAINRDSDAKKYLEEIIRTNAVIAARARDLLKPADPK